MKAKDLQIDDWVLVPDHEDAPPTNPARITMVNEFNALTVFCNGGDPIFNGEEVEPIPLTSEILEKNSFLKVEAIVYHSHMVGVSFLYRITPEGLRIFVQNACVGGPTCTMIKTCKYVHEVQHMIKMCDIEKEIIL